MIKKLFNLSEARMIPGFLVIENKIGVTHAINIEVPRSKSKSLALADADDMYWPHRIERHVEFENHETEIGIYQIYR